MLHLHPSIIPGRESRRETGAVLITGLLLMTVLTILVLSAVSSTILEERMASNIRDRQTAFQRAEQAFKVAEAALANSPYDPFVASSFSATCDSGNCFSAQEVADWATQVDWDTEGIDAGDGARYVVKFIGYASGSIPEPGTMCDVLFHVTARAPGNNENTFVILQTTERLRAGSCLLSF